MKWMHWGWEQLQGCPADLIPVIHAEMQAEAEAIKRQNRNRR